MGLFFRGGGGGGGEELSKVDLEEDEVEAFRIFRCLSMPLEVDFRFLSTITPRANFCSFDKRGGGGGDLKYTSLSILGGNLGLSSSVAEGTHQIRIFMMKDVDE